MLKKVSGHYVGENSEPLLCRLEDGVVYSTGLTMVMVYGDPLIKRVPEIIDRVFDASLLNYSISRSMHLRKLHSRKIAIVQKLDEYNSFNLYHIKPVLHLLLMGWSLSVIWFKVEVMHNRVFKKRK